MTSGSFIIICLQTHTSSLSRNHHHVSARHIREASWRRCLHSRCAARRDCCITSLRMTIATMMIRLVTTKKSQPPVGTLIRITAHGAVGTMIMDRSQASYRPCISMPMGRRYHRPIRRPACTSNPARGIWSTSMSHPMLCASRSVKRPKFTLAVSSRRRLMP